MSTAPAPHRAFRLTLRLDADSRSELVDALMSLATSVDRSEITIGATGGPSSGCMYELLHDPAQTHENYFREVRAYLARPKGPTLRDTIGLAISDTIASMTADGSTPDWCDARNIDVIADAVVNVLANEIPPKG